MVNYSRLFPRKPRWSKPSALARLPEKYYENHKQLEKPGARVHDDPMEKTYLDYQVKDPRTLRM